VYILKKEKEVLYASKTLHINNTVFDLSVQLGLILEFTVFQMLEHSACLRKYFGSDLIPYKAAQFSNIFFQNISIAYIVYKMKLLYPC